MKIGINNSGDTSRTRAKAATYGLLIPAVLSLGMSADTSYRFLGSTLQITDVWERAFLCGVAEAAIVALTVYAWATRTKGPAYLAYAAVLVQAIPAFQVSGGIGGPVRVVLGPVLLAVMLHLLLGLELRMSGVRSDSILSAALREVRERMVASLGIGRRGADSAAIARSRAADRAVDLADHVAAAKPSTRKHSRRAARLATAIDGARHGLSDADADIAESLIVSRVVRRKSVSQLASIEARHDWTASLPELTPKPELAVERPIPVINGRSGPTAYVKELIANEPTIDRQKVMSLGVGEFGAEAEAAISKAWTRHKP